MLAAILIFFDQRTNHIGLTAFIHLLLQKAQHAGALFFAGHHGADGGAARGQFVQAGNLQVAVQHQGQRAGNGCRAHHQQMSIASFLSQCGALLYTKAVLLVYHKETGIGKGHVALDQRMGAAENIDLPVGHRLLDLPLFSGGHGRDQQAYAQAKGREQLGQRGCVLPCQQLGGRHNSGLPMVASGQPGGGRRYQRLAAAHIALQQAVHAGPAAQITKNIDNGPCLCAGGGKGQLRKELVRVFGTHRSLGNRAQRKLALLQAAGQNE